MKNSQKQLQQSSPQQQNLHQAGKKPAGGQTENLNSSSTLANAGLTSMNKTQGANGDGTGDSPGWINKQANNQLLPKKPADSRMAQTITSQFLEPPTQQKIMHKPAMAGIQRSMTKVQESSEVGKLGQVKNTNTGALNSATGNNRILRSVAEGLNEDMDDAVSWNVGDKDGTATASQSKDTVLSLNFKSANLASKQKQPDDTNSLNILNKQGGNYKFDEASESGIINRQASGSIINSNIEGKTPVSINPGVAAILSVEKLNASLQALKMARNKLNESLENNENLLAGGQLMNISDPLMAEQSIEEESQENIENKILIESQMITNQNGLQGILKKTTSIGGNTENEVINKRISNQSSKKTTIFGANLQPPTKASSSISTAQKGITIVNPSNKKQVTIAPLPVSSQDPDQLKSAVKLYEEVSEVERKPRKSMTHNYQTYGGVKIDSARRKSVAERPFHQKNRLSKVMKRKFLRKKGLPSGRDSLQSSFDYIDVNINEALIMAGNAPQKDGRGMRLNIIKKQHEEADNWSSDESRDEKFLKMPNIKGKKEQYEKEIGLKLPNELKLDEFYEDFKQDLTDRDDPLWEARKMLPIRPFYKIIKKDRVQIIQDYKDRCPCLGLRKKLMLMRVYINRGAQMIMMHSLFETISICVIVTNSIFLAMDDPMKGQNETPYYMTLADDIFQYLYTLEMIVKIVSLGFVFNKGSYLRDGWNILDFVIIASGYMGMFLSGSGVKLSALRSFRVIRPLRTISSVAGLRVIVSALINALPLLRDSLLVLLFFFLVFAIAGSQLFTGALKNRCFNENTGVIDTTWTTFCGGGNSCRDGYYCAKSNENPSNGATNFDNVMFALLQVFQVVSMEGWTVIMVSLMQSVGTWIFIYFYPIIFIGAFFLLNLTLAVIKAKFTEEMKVQQDLGGPVKKKKKLDDAAPSSEDEDDLAKKVKDELDEIRYSNAMSPRSKENAINRLRIDHLLWRVDTTIQKRIASDQIVEFEDQFERSKSVDPHSNSVSDSIILKKKNTVSGSKSKIMTAVDKMTLFDMDKDQQLSLIPNGKNIRERNHNNLPYDEVFYSDKNTVIARPIRDVTQGGFLYEEEYYQESDDSENHRKYQNMNEKQDSLSHSLKSKGGSPEKWEKQDWSEQKKLRFVKQESQSSFQSGDVSPGIHIRKHSLEDDPQTPKVQDKKIIFAGMAKQKESKITITKDEFRRPSIDRNRKEKVYDEISKNFDFLEFLEGSISPNNKQENPKKTDNGYVTQEDINQAFSDQLDFDIDDNFYDQFKSEKNQGSLENSRRDRNVKSGSRGTKDPQTRDEGGEFRISEEHLLLPQQSQFKISDTDLFSPHQVPMSTEEQKKRDGLELARRRLSLVVQQLDPNAHLQVPDSKPGTAESKVLDDDDNDDDDENDAIEQSPAIKKKLQLAPDTRKSMTEAKREINFRRKSKQFKRQKMNVFQNDFRDEEEIQLHKQQIHLNIEKRYPEPKFKRKIQHKGIIESIKSFKIGKKQVENDTNVMEEYIRLRKKGKSQNYKDYLEKEEKRIMNDVLKIIKEESGKSSLISQEFNKDGKPSVELINALQNLTSIRAKAQDTKKRKQLVETLKYHKRMNVMRERRAQMFAHTIKNIGGVQRQLENEEYEKHVFSKYKIQTDPKMLDERYLRKRVIYRSASANGRMLQTENEEMISQDIMSHKDSLFLLKRRKDLDDECNTSVLNHREIEKMVTRKKIKDREEAWKIRDAIVPDMEKVLQQRKLKIVVKMKNMKFHSTHDIFQANHDPERFLTEQERKELNKQRRKEAAIKAKAKQHQPSKDMIVGYQKKIQVEPLSFAEDLLRHEYQDSDGDQDGMMTRLEDEFNYDHRSHVYSTGTISVVVNRPHHYNKIFNTSYHSNLKAIELDKKAWKKDILKPFKNIDTQQQIETFEGERILQKQGSFDEQFNALSSWRDKTSLKLNLGIQKPEVCSSNGVKYRLQNIPNFIYSQHYIPQLNQSPITSARRAISRMDNKVQVIAGGFSNKTVRPEPFTENQLIKILNRGFTESRIFSSLNIKNLPDFIYKDTRGSSANFRVRRKKPPQLVDIVSSDDDDEHVVRKVRVDYYLDRQINGVKQVALAREQAFKRPRDIVEWSGQDVLSKLDPFKTKLAIGMLNVVRVWPYRVEGNVKKARVLLRQLMKSSFIEHGMTVCVIGNTVVLSLDYYGASLLVQEFCVTANEFFTLTFAIEMILRITAIGPQKWLSDKMNYMDGTIVILSMIELLFMSGSGALSALRAVRIFRVFRVLRVARLLRGLKSMIQIINVISRSIQSFIYLALLLLLFVFIYALLGMQVFGGAFKDPEVVGTVRYNYDSFINAFITSFIMLTTENWNQIMFYAFSSDTSQALIAIYFISCIFIGNWMLLNLFLAILLDSFTQVEEEDMMTDEKKENMKHTMLEELKFKQGEDFIESMHDLNVEMFILGNSKKKYKRKNPPQQTQPANVLDESMEVDIEELNKKEAEMLAMRKQLFRGVDCQISCYLFTQQNPIRIATYKIVHHSKFENFIMMIIVFSSFKLVFDTYTDKLSEDDLLVVVSNRLDIVFQIFFTIEMLLKIVAFGFVMENNSYLTEGWSQLDFVIVVTGLIDTSLAGVNIAFLKVLRLLRILRPLRFLSHSSSMKTLIEALLASIPSIANVGVVIVVVFLMFAILGVNLFAGKLQYCTIDYYKINNKEECFLHRGTWENLNFNMDNVVTAMLTLFVVSNNEGWPDVMYGYCDATGVDTGPKPGSGLINAFFFIFFVFVGSFFFLNLFTGVLFMNFEKAQRDEKDAMHLDGEEVRWVDMMKMICDEQPEIIKIPKGKIRKWCFDFVDDEGPFANFIMTCIILNIFSMAANFEGQSDQYTGILEKINFFFTAAFTLECGFKLVAHGQHYFSSAWNKFDFFVVSASFLDIIMANMSTNSLKVIRVGPQLARIMRVMRVSRLFKLLNKYKGLQALIQTITFSLPSVINAFALLSLVYFIFSVLAVFFFKDVTEGRQIDDYMNFKNFTQSLMMMLRLSTGEDWPTVMFDLMDTKDNCVPGKTCGTIWAFAFFIIFVLIQQYIMVDLFVLIILQQFDLYYLPDDNVLDRFKSDLLTFKYTWKKYSAEFDGFKIRGLDINKFMKELKGDLGMSAEKSQKAVERQLVMMNIQADDEQFIYFNELLYKTMKRRYAPGRTKKKVLFELELETLEALEKIMNQQVYASRKKERQKAVAVNPFMAMMYKSMSFSVWKQMFGKLNNN